MKARATKTYQQLIDRLKSLRASKKKNEYKNLMDKICADYNISIKTVYRDLKKSKPGIRKPRADQGKERKPIPTKMLDKVYELMKAGKSQKEAIAMTGHISTKKAAKMQIDEPAESNFGEPIKELIKKIYEADKISLPLKLNINNRDVLLQPEEIEDIMMIIASAYNRAITDGDKMQVDRLQLAKSKLYYLLDEQIRIAQERYDLKAVELLSRIYERLKEKDVEMNTNFKVFQECMKELKPDITIDECISLIQKHSN